MTPHAPLPGASDCLRVGYSRRVLRSLHSSIALLLLLTLVIPTLVASPTSDYTHVETRRYALAGEGSHGGCAELLTIGDTITFVESECIDVQSEDVAVRFGVDDDVFGSQVGTAFTFTDSHGAVLGGGRFCGEDEVAVPEGTVRVRLAAATGPMLLDGNLPVIDCASTMTWTSGTLVAAFY